MKTTICDKCKHTIVEREDILSDRSAIIKMSAPDTSNNWRKFWRAKREIELCWNCYEWFLYFITGENPPSSGISGPATVQEERSIPEDRLHAFSGDLELSDQRTTPMSPENNQNDETSTEDQSDTSPPRHGSRNSRAPEGIDSPRTPR